MNKAELFEPAQVERIGTLLAEIDRLAALSDKLMERSVGAMAIAEGQKGHERIARDCPMLVAVSNLRAERDALLPNSQESVK